MKEDGDRVLDAEQWKIEAQAVIDDVKQNVTEIKISEGLQNTNQAVYLNLTTLEGSKYCVELSAAGFTIVGNQYDDKSSTGNEHFETPYSLLDLVSPDYRNSFGNLLSDKLRKFSDQ